MVADSSRSVSKRERRGIAAAQRQLDDLQALHHVRRGPITLLHEQASDPTQRPGAAQAGQQLALLPQLLAKAADDGLGEDRGAGDRLHEHGPGGVADHGGGGRVDRVWVDVHQQGVEPDDLAGPVGPQNVLTAPSTAPDGLAAAGPQQEHRVRGEVLQVQRRPGVQLRRSEQTERAGPDVFWECREHGILGDRADPWIAGSFHMGRLCQ